MIVVKENPDNTFNVCMGKSEYMLLAKIASGYSIPKHDMLASTIYKGMDIISRQLANVEERDKQVKESIDNPPAASDTW